MVRCEVALHGCELHDGRRSVRVAGYLTVVMHMRCKPVSSRRARHRLDGATCHDHDVENPANYWRVALVLHHDLEVDVERVNLPVAKDPIRRIWATSFDRCPKCDDRAASLIS